MLECAVVTALARVAKVFFHITPASASALLGLRRVRERVYVSPFAGPTDMRMFDDAQGHHWQAALMDASYGEVLLIFGRIGGAEVLQAPLGAEAANLADAEQFVEALDDDGLRSLLAKASPWNGNG